jgi:hypothetical protein
MEITYQNLLDNRYTVNFRETVYPPNLAPDFYDGYLTLWVTDTGIIASGRRIGGYFCNSRFKVNGCILNAKGCGIRTVFASWDDIKPMRMRKARTDFVNHCTIRAKLTRLILAAIRGEKRILWMGKLICSTPTYNYVKDNGPFKVENGFLYGIGVTGPKGHRGFIPIGNLTQLTDVGVDYIALYEQHSVTKAK